MPVPLIQQYRVASYITKQKLKVPDKIVSDVMTKKVVSVTKRASVSKCAKLMTSKNIEQMPVISPEDDFLGMIYDEDLMRAL